MKKVFLTIFLIMVSASVLYACQPEIQSHTRYLRKARAVFIGTPVAVTPNDSQDSEELKYFPYKIKFSVDKSWKGNKSEITVVSDNGSAPCGQVNFKIGEKYLVYAFGKRLFVTTYVGNRSRSLNKINDERLNKELAELDNFWFRLKSKLWFSR